MSGLTDYDKCPKCFTLDNNLDPDEMPQSQSMHNLLP